MFLGRVFTCAVAALVVAMGVGFPDPGFTAGPMEATELLVASGQAVVGEPAPWLAGWTLDEQVFNIRKPLADESIERLVLVFWASWCQPCRVGLSRLVEAAANLEGAGVAVVLINVGETDGQVAGFWGEQEPPFPVVLDPYRKSGPAYLLRTNGVQSLPLTAVINREGLVLKLLGAEGPDYIQHILAKD